MVSGFKFFLLGFFTILCASEGSRSFMGGSDVVHYVRVSFTRTTVATSWVHWSLVGDCYCTINTHFVTFLVGMGPCRCVGMGPRPGNVARGI